MCICRAGKGDTKSRQVVGRVGSSVASSATYKDFDVCIAVPRPFLDLSWQRFFVFYHFDWIGHGQRLAISGPRPTDVRVISGVTTADGIHQLP
jgi:hypothetical protein